MPDDPVYDPSRQIDLNQMPEVEREAFKPYKPKISVTEPGGATFGGGSYGALIQAACKRNWTPPGRGVLGRPIPRTEVEITIARTGRLLRREITRPSGNSELDRSVLEAIDLSNPFPAFPPELAGAEHKFRIQFVPED